MSGYQPIQLPQSQGPGIADALMAARDRQRQQQQDAWNQMMQQGEADRAQQTQNVHMQRLQFQMQKEQHDQQVEDQKRMEDVQKHVRDLHEKGLGHEAQQFAELHGFHGGQLPNANPDPGQAPQEPQQPEFVGPLDTPEHASELAMQDNALVGGPFANEQNTQQAGDEAAQSVVDEQAKRDEFGVAQQQYPEQMRKFDAQSRAYQEGEANPQFSYQTPGGQSFSVDPRERLMAARQQQKERATTLMGALGEQPGAERIGAEVGAGREPEQAFDDQTKRVLAGLGMANKLELARMKQKKGGGGDGPDKEEIKDTNARSKEFRTFVKGSTRSPGVLPSLQRIQSVIETMDEAVARGDRTATTAAIEQGSRLLSGAAPTRTSTHLLTELQSASDELKSKVGKFFDDPGYSMTFAKRIQQLLRNTEQEYLAQLDDTRESFTEQELAAGEGLANKPALKHKVMGTLGMLNKVRNPDGSLRYQSDGGGKEQRPQQAKTAPANGAPAGTTKVNMPDGSVQEFDASGKRVK